MALRRADLLTVNSIIITGVLILLTISDVGKNIGLVPSDLAVAALRVIVTLIILPFALSCIVELNKEGKGNQDSSDCQDTEKSSKASKNGIRLMKIGFVYLVAVIVTGYLLFAIGLQTGMVELPINSTN